MGMILHLIPATRAELDQLLANPDTVTGFIERADGGTDLDKAWHGIHFLLCGTEWPGSMPEGLLLAGGVPIGDVDVGYGPARAVSPDDVARFHAAISRISDADFDARFDARRLLEFCVYPEIWDRDLKGEPDGRPYLNEYFAILKQFFSELAKSGKGVVVFIG